MARGGHRRAGISSQSAEAREEQVSMVGLTLVLPPSLLVDGTHQATLTLPLPEVAAGGGSDETQTHLD